MQTFTTSARQVAASSSAWFGPYVDVTLTPAFEFEQLDVEVVRDVVLAFVVADPESPCEPSWGGYYGLDEASSGLDLDRRLERFRAAGGALAVSFGGALNDELALVCDDVDRLADAYGAVIDRYGIDTIDLDIEGGAANDVAANERRAEAIAALQGEAADDDRQLAVWLTLPVTPAGVPTEFIGVIDAMLAADVDLAGVNLMTMNFGASADGDGLDMSATSRDAVTAFHRQLRSSYERAGTPLGGEQLWSKIGITPMVGENDDPGNVTSLDDARDLADFVLDQGLSRVSIWSLNRDRPCSENRSDRVSNLCSGTEQTEMEFSSIFAAMPGTMTDSAGVVVEPLAQEVVDDPALSPYPIWDEGKGYAKGKKVVWRREVYEAKWWTEGQQPDAPVVNEWETPWRYVGPVLEGERAPTMTTLASGTYPDWDPDEIYDKGDMVLLNGVPYRAKWWTQGTPPDIEVQSEFDTPWEQIGLPDGW